MAPHSSTLAWKIPWMEEPGRLQSMESRRVGHDWATSLSLFTFMHWRRKWQPTPVFLPGESQGRGAWWAAVSGVAQGQTQLKRLSSSSSKHLHRASQMAQVVKNPPVNERDARHLGLIPGSGKCPGGGNDNPLQYSCLGNPMDWGAWWASVHGVAKSWTGLSMQTYTNPDTYKC